MAKSGRSPRGGPALKSNVALVIDAAQGETLYAKHSDQVAPIASITKLMTAMVVLDAQTPLDEVIEIERAPAFSSGCPSRCAPLGPTCSVASEVHLRSGKMAVFDVYSWRLLAGRLLPL